MDVKNVQVFCILSLWKAPDPNRTYWRKRRPSGHSAVDLHPIWWGSPPLICIYIYTRAPKTNIRFRPWKSMVGSDKFKFGMSYFQRRAASFRESVYIMCIYIYIFLSKYMFTCGETRHTHDYCLEALGKPKLQVTLPGSKVDLNSIIHHPVWHPKTARTWPQWETLTYDVPWDTDLLRGILIRLTELPM